MSGDPEVQALLALCHHNPVDHDCQACQFRAAAAVEHIVESCEAVIESIDATPSPPLPPHLAAKARNPLQVELATILTGAITPGTTHPTTHNQGTHQMSEQPWIVDQPDKIAFRDELGNSVCWASIDDAYTDEARAHKVTFEAAGYEYVKNGSDDWWHTDGDLYQGSTLMRVLRRKSDGKLFGFSYWEGGGKHGETMIEHNGDDHGFPSKYDWEDGVEEEERWYVFMPIVEKPIPAYVFEQVSSDD